MARTPRIKLLSTQLLFCFFAVVAVLGCSSTHSEAPAGRVADPLTFPVTVTLATPNAVAPTAPVLEGSNSLQLGARSTVVTGSIVSMGAGGLSTQPDALLNDTWSRGAVTFGDRTSVRGTLHAKTVTLGNSTNITTRDTNPLIDPVQTLSWKVTFPSGTANNVTLNRNDVKSLAPGRYGTITQNGPSTLTLSTGTYFLTGLSLQSGAVVKLDQARGPVIIYVTDSLILRGTFTPIQSNVAPDLLITYFGTAAIYVETLFNGALVAPSASSTLRSVTGTHTGFFAAKDQIVDAGASVQYRAPLAIITASNPTGPQCQALLAALGPGASPSQYCPICASPDDTDRDGKLDCVDGCPSDAQKTAPGVCGCGVPDTDSDGDGVPDCFDQCPNDANNTSAGQCGCVRPSTEPQDLAPAGTRCSDPACPQTNAQCNGAGVCGNRSSCQVAAGCKLVTFQHISYWFCPGPVTQAAASQACRAKQMKLVQLDGISENSFVKSLVSKLTWVGANSITTSGTWRWSTPTSNDGTQFWAGAATGSQRSSLFSNWASGAPASQRCVALQPSDGRWVDVDCTQSLGYVCESPLPAAGPGSNPKPPGGSGQPPVSQTTCVSEASVGLPPPGAAGLAQLQADFDATKQLKQQGAAAHAPTTNTCVDVPADDALGSGDGTAGCQFTVAANAATAQCFQDSDCAAFGPSLVCRQVKDDPGCTPDHPSGDAGICTGHARCGTLNCPAVDTTLPCDQIQVCASEPTDFNPNLDTDSHLTPAPFDPAKQFGGTLPAATSAGTYSDPPKFSGKDHSWCFMDAQNPVPTATQPQTMDEGHSSGGSHLSFQFKPDLLFDANVNPLSLGETNLGVHARAQLVAGISLTNFLGGNYSGDILSAVADIQAERCSIRDTATQFTVLGGDFVDPDSPWIFDTAEGKYAKETATCSKAVGEFALLVNRAKKAFRDVQQLLTAYKSLQSGTHLQDLCEQLVGLADVADVGFFPGGLHCPAGEPTEITINRFLDYYQAPGFGQVAELKRGIKALTDATAALKKALGITRSFNIVDIGKEESQTILDVPFAIGPVPMVLQVDAFYGYGVAGGFEFALEFPFDPLNSNPGDRNEIAHVKAGVMPHADAGLSAFVGAGTSLGGFSATLGIEGQVTLGNIKAPIFAGAGVGAEVLSDIRPIPAEIAPPASVALDAAGLTPLTHFGIPKSFKFYVWYDYGAGLDVQNVLSGTINARLRIKFFFFSRTWRKKVVSFNGWSKHFDLLSGKVGTDPAVGMKTETIDPGNSGQTSTNTVEGTNNMGLAEPQTTLPVLAPLPVPTTAPTGTGVTFDNSALEKPFYDSLCCSKKGEACIPPGTIPQHGGPATCCPGADCVGDATNGFTCEVVCKTVGQSCKADDDCCNTNPSLQVSCNMQACTQCGRVADDSGHPAASCSKDSDCCGGTTSPRGEMCDDGECVIGCSRQAEHCARDTDCCPVAGSAVTCHDPGLEDSACVKCSLAGIGSAGGDCTQDSDCCGGTDDPPGATCDLQTNKCQIVIP